MRKWMIALAVLLVPALAHAVPLLTFQGPDQFGRVYQFDDGSFSITADLSGLVAVSLPARSGAYAVVGALDVYDTGNFLVTGDVFGPDPTSPLNATQSLLTGVFDSSQLVWGLDAGGTGSVLIHGLNTLDPWLAEWFFPGYSGSRFSFDSEFLVEGYQVASYQVRTEAVPEPATLLLLASGLLGAAGLLRRRRPA